MNYQKQGAVIVIGNRVIIDGEKLPSCPAKGGNSTIINGKVYIGGYEFKKGKWRKTLRALFHKYF